MNLQVNRVTNANIYIDGVNLLGTAEEVSAPMIKHKMSEHKALGMVGTVEFWSGIEKMESKIKWNSFYRDVLEKAANPFKSVQIQVRGSVEIFDSTGRSSEQPIVMNLTAQFKDFPMGNFKQHDNVELENNLNVTYAKMTMNGQEILEIDVLANVYKVNGQDVLGTYRANIGG